jgi:hypothetical protein
MVALQNMQQDEGQTFWTKFLVPVEEPEPIADKIE